MVRGMDMPLWDDSVQHTVMVQRILEAGGLFQSWLPYTPYRTLTTQFGFPAQIAIWSWFIGASAPQAVIWAGQVLGILAVLTLYPLGYRIKGPWVGLITVLIAGGFSQFPAYYTNWGRYPQMAGQAILPVAERRLWAMLDEKEQTDGLPAIVGAGILIAGMTLTDYRHGLSLPGLWCRGGTGPAQITSQLPERRQRWLAVVAVVTWRSRPHGAMDRQYHVRTRYCPGQRNECAGRHLYPVAAGATLCDRLPRRSSPPGGPGHSGGHLGRRGRRLAGLVAVDASVLVDSAPDAVAGSADHPGFHHRHQPLHSLCPDLGSIWRRSQRAYPVTQAFGIRRVECGLDSHRAMASTDDPEDPRSRF